MSVEANLPEIIKTAAEFTAGGFALAIPGIAGVTAFHHRELTHRSLKLHPALQRFIRWEMRVYSPIAELWAEVHRGHHRQPDLSRKRFLDAYRANEWKREQPQEAEGFVVPDSVSHFAKGVERFSMEEVSFIGQEAEGEVMKRKGESYKRPLSYTKEKWQEIFYPTEDPVYPEVPKKGTDYTQDEEETIILEDPHSPMLTGKENPVRAVLRGNVRLYRQASHLYRDHPEYMSPDLKTDAVVNYKITRIRGFVEGSLMAAGIVALAHGLDPSNLEALRNGIILNDQVGLRALEALGEGTILNLIKLGFHIEGGNITNSLGHAGKMTSGKFVEAIFGKKYEPEFNDDGTVSTDSVDGGLLGRGISTITFDEVGGQKWHHLFPWLIPYTIRTGLKGVIEAPWGKLLDYMARNKHFPFINVGEGFPELMSGEVRPDMPTEGGRLIQQRQAEEVKRMKALQAAQTLVQYHS